MRYKRQIASILSIVTALWLWQMISWWVGYPQLIPPVDDLLVSVIRLFFQPAFYTALGATLIRGIAGIIIAFALALPVGFLCGRNTFWLHYFNPLLSALRSTPVIAFILLIILWLPSETVATTIALMAMFPVLCENIIKGVQSLNAEYEQLANTYQLNRRVRIKHLYWPALKPFIESGLTTAFGFGWKAIIMGEVLSRPFAGIGVQMKDAQTFINVPNLIAWTLIAIIVSFVFTELLQRSLHFHYKQNRIDTGMNGQGSALKPSCDIVLSNISKQYKAKVIFDGLTASFPAQKTSLIAGISGSGKSTLLNLIAGATSLNSGKISGNDTRIGYMFQAPLLIPWLTVRENILLTAPVGTHISNFSGILDVLELSALLDRYPDQLSGGEQRRVSLARALASRPQLLLVDEPFAGMDKERMENIADFIIKWCQTNKITLIIALHEPSPLFYPETTLALQE